MKQLHLPPNIRREDILNAVLKLARKNGIHYRSLTRDEIAREAKTATGNVSRLFGSMAELRREAVKYAIKKENKAVIMQAICVRDSALDGCPHALKKMALNSAID